MFNVASIGSSSRPVRCIQSVFAPVVPDPHRPAFPYLLAKIPSQGKRWESYQRRRSEILATSRRMLSDVGFDRVCMREIARSSAISVPTIYNIVGDRAAVLREASSEWTRWLAAATCTRDPGDSRILAVLESFWMSALMFPDYVSSAARICAIPESPLIETFAATSRQIFGEHLMELRAAGALRPWIDVESLSRQLVCSIQIGVGNWAFSGMAPEEYRRGFAYGPGLMLLAAVEGSEVRSVERTLEAIIHAGGEVKPEIEPRG